MFTKCLIFLALATCPLFAHIEFVIVTPSYNNERYCIANLSSVAKQTYPHWTLLYTNDCSSDKTGLLAETYIQEQGLSKKCKITHNPSRKGAMHNIYKMVHAAPSTSVIVHLDGDDQLAHPRVLERLAEVYRNPSVWVTYGNYISDPDHIESLCRPFPEQVMKERLFRSHPWVSSHLKTYYAALFHEIDKKDLQDQGAFVDAASDVAFMMPILEMASYGHIKFIPEVLYIYNFQNPLSDQKVRVLRVEEVDRKIRSRKRYEALRCLPTSHKQQKKPFKK